MNVGKIITTNGYSDVHKYLDKDKIFLALVLYATTVDLKQSYWDVVDV